MVKRVQIAERTKEDEAPKAGKKKRKAGKTLLSFGGEDGEEEGPSIKKAKVNPNFKSSKIESGEALNNAPMAAAPKEAAPKAAKSLRRRSPSRSTSPAAMGAGKHSPTPVLKQPSPSPSPSPEPAQVEKTMSALERTNAEIAALKASMKRNVSTQQDKPEKKQSALEAMIPATATRGRKRGKVADEAGALNLFNQFKQRLGTAPEPAPESISEPQTAKITDASTTNRKNGTTSTATAMDTEESLCDLHFIANCQSCNSWDDEAKNAEAAEDDDDPNWMSHKLSFAKDVLGKDLEWKRKMEEFEVIDPREKARDIAGEKRRDRGGDKERHKGKGTEWGGRRDREGRGNRARV